MNIILTEIGFFGPVILFGFIIYLTRRANNQTITLAHSTKKQMHPQEKKQNEQPITKRPEIYAYLFFWQALNYALNEILKRLIQEPRPTDIAYINTWDSAPNIGPYGMPSGHAQQVVSETIFIALTFKSPLATFTAICIAILTIYQRYIYQKHTIWQLVVGASVGMITGSSFYIFLSHHM